MTSVDVYLEAVRKETGIYKQLNLLKIDTEGRDNNVSSLKS